MLELKNVSFSAENDTGKKDIIKNVNLKIDNVKCYKISDISPPLLVVKNWLLPADKIAKVRWVTRIDWFKEIVLHTYHLLGVQNYCYDYLLSI